MIILATQQAANKWLGFKLALPKGRALYVRSKMQLNYLYFIEESYFEKYKNDTVSQNQKEDEEHRRPCYYAFKEDSITG